ncbi:hypothetical protein T4C_2624 [Trichinella pseudospiralis]|uniref:Uncharacterized protein n=1 Tax=Trichinella pseudospiralis TaxID=6337 RepID=A0A0V1K5N5_TRIPS|nr:hypothetical protein T4C_2624 [Trichinella pseudospiralis]
MPHRDTKAKERRNASIEASDSEVQPLQLFILQYFLKRNINKMFCSQNVYKEHEKLVKRKRKAFACASSFHKLAHVDHVHMKSKSLDFASCI